MKKKVKAYSKVLKMPLIYMDDLRAIEKIIKEELKPREYKLETADYEYDKLDDIQNNNETNTELLIRTYSPRIIIDFNRYGARIYASDDNLDTIGALTKIYDILALSERVLLYKSQKFAMWVAPIFMFLPLMLLYTIDNVNKYTKWGLLMFSCLSLIWWAVSLYIGNYKYSILYFTDKKDNPGFLKRHKDQIILGSISAIFTAIIGLFIRG